MKSAALSNGSGPGSSIALSPTSIRVRDAIIEKFIDKSLDELNIFLTSALTPNILLILAHWPTSAGIV